MQKDLALIDDFEILDSILEVKEGVDLPVDFTLQQNYPNPFNAGTRIAYALPRNSHVKLSIFNLLGRTILELLDEPQTAGDHTINWDGRDADGIEVATGVYFYRLEAGQHILTRRMIFVR